MVIDQQVVDRYQSCLQVVVAWHSQVAACSHQLKCLDSVLASGLVAFGLEAFALEQLDLEASSLVGAS